MKLTKSFEKEDFANKLESNKDLLLPIGVLVGGLLIILFFVVPQLLSFPSKLSERNSEVARLDEIRAAKEILASTNDSVLDSQVETVSNVLPIDRGFESIFNSISESANLSNVQIGGYVFNDSGQVVAEEGQEAPSRILKFTILINGTPDQAALFLEELYKTGPLAGINRINYVDGATEIEVDFYYKPFTVLDQNSFLPSELTSEQQEIYNKISGFAKPAPEPVFDIPQEASPSPELSEN